MIILISGVILRVAGMNDPVSYDEAYTYVGFASRSLWAIISDYSLPNNHIFHSLLVHFSVMIWGNHPWSLRLPALLAGLLTILAAYGFGKAAYSEESGLTAAAIVAYFPELVRFSTEARGYSLVGLFTLLIFWLGWQLVDQSDRRIWFLLTLCTSLGFWTIPTMLFPAGALYLWLFLQGLIQDSGKKRKYFISFFVSGVGVGILTFLLYAPVLKISGWRQLFANGFVQPINAQEYFDFRLANRLLDTWQEWTKDVPSLLTMLLILGFVFALMFHWKITSPKVLFPLQLATFGWIALLIVTRRPDAYDRFWSFLIAPLLIWGTAGIIEIARKLPHLKDTRPDLVLSILAVVFVLVQSSLSIPAIQTRWDKTGNPEAAAIYLKDLLQPDDLVLVGYPNNAPLWYYLGLYHIPETTWRAHTDAPATYFVLAANQEGQTLETIMKSYEMNPVLFQLDRAEFIQRYGQMMIYRLER
jgi:4-amino-4-deoxy-L-arabinose transferase-like glycosyltransferase